MFCYEAHQTFGLMYIQIVRHKMPLRHLRVRGDGARNTKKPGVDRCIATLAGAGPALPHGGGWRLRGTLGGRPREGRSGGRDTFAFAFCACRCQYTPGLLASVGAVLIAVGARGPGWYPVTVDQPLPCIYTLLLL